ncbi:hypothetical protein FKW77_007916 [Venturia effusa]|uniref:Secreted protein n=1 Tax=Venturia effusa TaxID=50376 RepID=A0A517LLV0_9PEZI|nr:hypothetical protein FKW77_007916 [Venturia effusa]
MYFSSHLLAMLFAVAPASGAYFHCQHFKTTYQVPCVKGGTRDPNNPGFCPSTEVTPYEKPFADNAAQFKIWANKNSVNCGGTCGPIYRADYGVFGYTWQMDCQAERLYKYPYLRYGIPACVEGLVRSEETKLCNMQCTNTACDPNFKFDVCPRS